MPDEAVVESVLAAMADPTRRHILDILARRDGISATVVADQLPVSRQAVVKHLGILDQAGLVSARRFGREVRYSVRTRALAVAGDWLTQLAAQWQSPDAPGPVAPEPPSADPARPPVTAVSAVPDQADAPTPPRGSAGLTVVPDLSAAASNDAPDDRPDARPDDGRGVGAPAGAGQATAVSIPADLMAAVAAGTRLAGHLADRAYGLIPGPVATLLPRFLRR